MEKKFKTLEINGVGYKTLYTEKFENRKAYIEPDARKVKSLIPGTIVEIYVENAQPVEYGEPLFAIKKS